MGQSSPNPIIDYLRFLRGIGFTHLPTSAAQIPAEATTVPAVPERTSKPVTPSAVKETHPTPTLDSGIDLFDVATAQAPPLSREEREAKLRGREDELQSCERCKLCPERNRVANRLVYGVGSAESEIVFVGEGPGEEEDRQGIPFVGRAGELLTKIIGAMGMTRDDVYICNVVKHRPPGNRDPERDEIDACEPFLLEQLDIIRPRVLVTLGNCATKTLLRTTTGITKLRGTWQTYHGIPTMPTYHPAYLLRSYTRANREAVWEDMKAVIAKRDALRAG